MKKNLKHYFVGVGAFVVASLPLVLADSNVQHEIAKHPAVAVYLPLVTGLAHLAGKKLAAEPTKP